MYTRVKCVSGRREDTCKKPEKIIMSFILSLLGCYEGQVEEYM